MDSKTTVPAYIHEEDAGPPSYDDTTNSPHPTSSSSTSRNYSSQIQSDLQSLNPRVAIHDIHFEGQEEKIFLLLTRCIPLYISDFAKTSFQKGRVIIVPAKAVYDHEVTLPKYDSSKITEYEVVVKLPDKECDGYTAGDLWYWKDIDMAKRLAAYLYLRPPAIASELAKRKEPVKQSPSKGRRFFGKTNKEREYRIAFDVKVEQVMLKLQDETGMYVRGSGIVLLLRVVTTQQYDRLANI